MSRARRRFIKFYRLLSFSVLLGGFGGLFICFFMMQKSDTPFFERCGMATFGTVIISLLFLVMWRDDIVDHFELLEKEEEIIEARDIVQEAERIKQKWEEKLLDRQREGLGEEQADGDWLDWHGRYKPWLN